MSNLLSQLVLVCLSQLFGRAFSLGLQYGAYAPQDTGGVADPQRSYTQGLDPMGAATLNQASTDPPGREPVGSFQWVGATVIPDVMSAPVDTPSMFLSRGQQRLQQQQQQQQQPFRPLRQGPLGLIQKQATVQSQIEKQSESVGLQPQLNQIQQMQEDLTTVSSQGVRMDAQTNIEQEIRKTQVVASQLAQDASALSDELAKLEGALRGQPISQHARIADSSTPTMSSDSQAELMSLETCRDACKFRNSLGLRGCCEFALGICDWHADSFVDSSRFIAGRFATNCHSDNEGCLPMSENVCEGEGLGVAITAQGFTAPTEGLDSATDYSLISERIVGSAIPYNGTANSTNSTNDTNPSWFDLTTFPSPFFTLGHRLSDFWTVVFWIAVGLVFLIFSCCCFRCFRRAGAGGERLL